MKDSTKAWIAIPSAIAIASIPVWGFIAAWSWCMSQIPSSLEYAGLIKIGVSALLILIGGSTTLFLSIGGGALTLALFVAILG